MKKIVFLVSGGGGTLKFVHNSLIKLDLPIKIVGIVADREVSLEKFANEKSIFFIQIKYFFIL